MDKKILVHVYSPAATTTYDMWLPLNISVQAAATMIGKAVNTLSNGLYACDDVPALYDRSRQSFLNSTVSVYESGIGNSSTLILV
ncbi:MAG: hypothetical protein EOM45_01235 [Clostridia bacterium]|nr:hypothetical protein [Clostridia bacterium]